MKHKDERMDEYIREKLSKLSHTPARDPAKAAQARASFLAQVHAHAPGRDLSVPVPLSPSLRLKGWINQVFGSNTQWEGHKMLKAITAVIVIGVMFFGGAGATVYAAQDALPNDALYPLKTVTEDLRLAFALDAQAEIDLLLNYSDRRVGEILALSRAGEVVPEDVVVRLNAEMDLLEDIITDLDEPELSDAVEKVGVHIWDRDRISWNVDYDMLRNLAAWTEIEECSLPEDYSEQLAAYELLLVEYEANPESFGEAPVAPVCEEWVGTGEWEWAQPGPHYYFRNNQPDNGKETGQPQPVEITDTEIISDTEILGGSGTDGLLLEGNGQGAGPFGPSDENPPGPGSDQGNGASRSEAEDAQKAEGAYKYQGNDTQVGAYYYPFLEYFNLPTPKANGTGGGGKK